jgi:hypothetical protein
VHARHPQQLARAAHIRSAKPAVRLNPVDGGADMTDDVDIARQSRERGRRQPERRHGQIAFDAAHPLADGAWIRAARQQS